MPSLVTVQKEKTVRDLAARVYGTTSETALDRAEKALLKANPHLVSAKELRAGAVGSVPAVSGLKARADATDQDPAAALRGGVAEAAAGYRDALAQRLGQLAGELDAQNKLLQTREVAAAIKSEPGGPELAKQLAETLGQRAKLLAEARKNQAALFDAIAADLKKLDPR